MLAYFIVDPSPNILKLPLLNHPITWYGLFFALGFFLAYFIVRALLPYILKKDYHVEEVIHQKATHITDELTLYIILGTLLGARLGHVFFYEWPFYKAHPLAIFKIWEGGLASHGGALGVLLALLLFYFNQRKKYPCLTFVALMDLLVIPTALVAGCIRIGNFINQEILGRPTTLPWGVVFRHPAQSIDPSLPLHPVQIYESLAYFTLFLLLLALWKWRKKKLGEGLLSGTFFLLLFTFRFFIEFLKLPQSIYDQNRGLNMGQLLSLPFILVGLLFFGYYCCSYEKRE